MNLLKVGRIPFLVCAPYFHESLAGLPGVSFADGPPRALNRLLASGSIDCAPSSSFEYARNASEYLLLPGLCTSGRGEVKSVLLFSRLPWESLTGQTVWLSPESDTSNALVRVLSRFRFGIEPTFQLSDLAETSSEGKVAMVAIGDNALREAADAEWPYRYDLARVWQEWQGTPLPLGLWIVRAQAAHEKADVVGTYALQLKSSLESFFVNPDGCLDEWERAYELPLGRAEALDFFSTADYVLTPAHEQALATFFDLCARAGLIAAPPPLKWFGGKS